MEDDSIWFREPSKRERKIAAGLFLGFGLFFLGLAYVQRGLWFAWIVLALAGISLYSSARHAMAGWKA